MDEEVLIRQRSYRDRSVLRVREVGRGIRILRVSRAVLNDSVQHSSVDSLRCSHSLCRYAGYLRYANTDIEERARSNAERTESRREHRITTKHQGTTCFACRGIGHAARDCPNVLLAAAGGANAVEGTAAMLGDGAASTALQVDEASKGAKVTEVGKDEGKGMKRGKGKKGGEITTGRCYR